MRKLPHKPYLLNKKTTWYYDCQRYFCLKIFNAQCLWHNRTIRKAVIFKKTSSAYTEIFFEKMTGRFRVRVAVSSHCIGGGKACHWHPSPDPAQSGSSLHWVRPFCHNVFHNYLKSTFAPYWSELSIIVVTLDLVRPKNWLKLVNHGLLYQH